MNAPTPDRIVRVAAILAGAGALLGGTAAAVAQSGHTAVPKKASRTGVGPIKLGKTHRELREAGLVGKLRPGCVLGGPSTRSARLLAPLKGSAEFTQTRPRRVVSLTVTRGAAARAVGIGATSADIKEAFPRVRFEHATDSVFGYTLAKVPRHKGEGSRLEFAVSVRTGRVSMIGVPGIAVCD